MVRYTTVRVDEETKNKLQFLKIEFKQRNINDLLNIILSQYVKQEEQEEQEEDGNQAI